MASAEPSPTPNPDAMKFTLDVTLPASGNGPWPTLVMLHGFPGDKSAFEATDAEGSGSPVRFHRNNVFYAQRGYAVVNYSSRGFGRSCGVTSSRS